MPRARTGNGGNRTDLLNPRQPVRTAPGQEYGQADQQRQSQGSIPLAGAGANPAASAPLSAATAPPPASAPPPPPRMPVQVTPLTAPTERPDEPVTSGLPNSPGPGPEAMGSQGFPLSHILGMLSNSPQAGAGTFETAAMARMLGI